MNRRRWLAAAAAACMRGGGARSESQESEGNEQHPHGVDRVLLRSGVDKANETTAAQNVKHGAH